MASIDGAGTGKDSQRGKPRLTKAYGFGLVTAALVLLSWTGQFVTQLIVVRGDNEEHGRAFPQRSARRVNESL